MKTESEFFTSWDLNLAAVLVASGIQLDLLEKQSNGKALFYFRRSSELDEVVQAFWAQQMKLNPHSLFTALKFLKNRMYSNY